VTVHGAQASPQCFDHAADLPAAQWSRLLGPHDFFLSPAWLRVIEASAGVPMRYLLLHCGGDPIAALSTALADGDVSWALGRPDAVLARCEREGRPGAAAVRAMLPNADLDTLLPSLVCGGRHLGRNRVLTVDAADVRVLDTMVTAAEKLAADFGAASTAYLYVDQTDRALRSVLDERGYVSFESGEVSALAVPPDGFEGYLHKLTGHRRRRVLAERRACAAAGIETRIEPLAAALIPRLAELETQLYHKYGARHWRPQHSERALSTILDEFAGAALVSVARAAGAVRGFGLILPFEGSWLVHRSGFDYGYQGRLPLYFETLFYHPLDAAAAMRIGMLQFGTGSADTKRSRGCHVSAQRGYLRMLSSS
jgi:predicted N-acyltransferase